jgi:hypothetical protein
MIREALVNDAALFVGWKMRGVLRTRSAPMDIKRTA